MKKVNVINYRLANTEKVVEVKSAHLEGRYWVSNWGYVYYERGGGSCGGGSERASGRASAERLVCTPQDDGRWVYMRFLGGHIKKVLVGYLVARAFVPNPELREYVKWKDGDKGNNTAGNLVWTDEVPVMGRPRRGGGAKR